MGLFLQSLFFGIALSFSLNPAKADEGYNQEEMLAPPQDSGYAEQQIQSPDAPQMDYQVVPDAAYGTSEIPPPPEEAPPPPRWPAGQEVSDQPTFPASPPPEQ